MDRTKLVPFIRDLRDNKENKYNYDQLRLYEYLDVLS
jgi:hypothetical protein